MITRIDNIRDIAPTSVKAHLKRHGGLTEAILDLTGFKVRDIDGVYRSLISPILPFDFSIIQDFEEITVEIAGAHWLLEGLGFNFETLELAQEHRGSRRVELQLALTVYLGGYARIVIAEQSHLMPLPAMDYSPDATRIALLPQYYGIEDARREYFRRRLSTKDHSIFMVAVFKGEFRGASTKTGADFKWVYDGKHTVIGCYCTDLDIDAFLKYVDIHEGCVVMQAVGDWSL